MDNLHFIPNNIFIKFFKELTKYKNDYQQYLNYIYIYIRIILCILLYIFKCINIFAQGYNLQASKKNNKRRSIVTLKTLKGIPIFKGNHKGFFLFIFFRLRIIFLVKFTLNILSLAKTITYQGSDIRVIYDRSYGFARVGTPTNVLWQYEDVAPSYSTTSIAILHCISTF